MNDLEFLQDVLNNKNSVDLYNKAYTHTGIKRAICILQAANLGHVEAQEKREYIYLFIDDLEDSLFLHFITATVLQNHPDSLNTLGVIHKENDNHEEAIKLFEKAAEQDYFQAFENLGHTYAYGTGVNVDFQRAKILFEKAIKLGSATALNTLGVIYYDGELTEKNIDKAVEYFERAAERKHIRAVKNLINHYRTNKDVRKKYEKKLEELSNNPLY